MKHYQEFHFSQNIKTHSVIISLLPECILVLCMFPPAAFRANVTKILLYNMLLCSACLYKSNSACYTFKYMYTFWSLIICRFFKSNIKQLKAKNLVEPGFESYVIFEPESLTNCNIAVPIPIRFASSRVWNSKAGIQCRSLSDNPWQ